MADVKLARRAISTPIDDGATLANGVRAAGDLENDTNLDLFGIPYLEAQYDATAPTAGDEVAQLWVLPGDGEATEDFPEGGDAGLGTDDDPQQIFYVGSFATVNPSITVNETLALPPHPLYPGKNRYVLKNVSGQTFDLTWELRVATYYFTVT